MITFEAIGRYGRLGNQLFQVAATIGLAQKTGHEAVFPIWENAGKLNVKTLSVEVMNRIRWQPRWEHGFSYDSTIHSPIKEGENISLQGYLQSEKYFEHCKKEVYEAIMTPENVHKQSTLAIKYGIQQKKVLAIHVRLGDYLGLPNHYTNLTNTGYYSDALMYTAGWWVDEILVFSDDINRCKGKIKGGAHVKYSENETPFDDMLLMAACQYHIIGNSSFSWWGSWLAGTKKVIAPKQWFGPALPHNTSDLYRPEMVLL